MYNISPVFGIGDLRSAGGHDFVMLSLWENIQIAPILKIPEISDLYHFGASIPQFVTVRDFFLLFFGWTYPSVGSNKVN